MYFIKEHVISQIQKDYDYTRKQALDFYDRIDDIKKAKSEAIKEFAERLKEKRYSRPMSQAEYFGLSEEKWVVNVDVIDNLVKEMVGEDDAC